MTTIERRLIQERSQKLQYLTLSRGVSNGELPDNLAHYGARVQHGPKAGELRSDAGIRVNALIRFDDDCGNGQCTFSISGNVSDDTRDCGACGQITDLLAFVFPELQPFFKWHLVSTDGPMHYLANTVYHAGDRDHYGLRAGEPSSFEYGVRFNNVPITHRIRSKSFFQFVKSRVEANAGEFQIFAIAHDREPKTYSPHYSLVGYADKWHQCPFNDKTEAEEFSKALNTCKVEFVRVPTAWSNGKARELDAARNAAVWPEATDEELSVELEELKLKLIARLPGLMAEFRAAVESLGFDYEWPAKTRQPAISRTA